MNNIDQTIAEELKLLERNVEQVKKAARSNIAQPPALMYINGEPLFRPFTINAIQGKEGSHKSRLAEIISTAALAVDNAVSSPGGNQLNIVANPDIPCHVLYVDTERNTQDEFPTTIQALNANAGHRKFTISSRFTPVPLLNVSRQNRLAVLQMFVENLRKKVPNLHMLVVLDVSTDCIDDFNSSASANRIHDWMNVMRTQFDMTFLLLIHENPGGSSDKARGHVGTELTFKASTQLQIRRVDVQEDKEVFQLVFKKMRFKRRYAPIYVAYSDEYETLVQVEYDDAKESKPGKEDSAVGNDLHTALAEAFKVKREYSRNELAEAVAKKLGGKFNENTIKRKLGELAGEAQFILNINGGGRFAMEKRGRETFYLFQPTVHQESDSTTVAN
ncbi:AAA family ATPase [Chitinophaga hostae]|uniref:AAA family ATPase n=1 Tax=Chitinophaga hostae TaxID=2831022 RepID=A0ABS5IVW6_9BACT|nr:AAA family ATPase [Chitinophaga hostae]MBS0027112.1 AAA family ATPase [Chitinophaga hostae]